MRFLYPLASGKFGGQIWGQVGSMTECPPHASNDTKIRQLKPLTKSYKVSDAHGLYLLVNPNDSRRGSHNHTARLLASITNHIFPASLNESTTPFAKHHYPAWPLTALPDLQTRIDAYQQGRVQARLALKLTLPLFVRSSELRFARWHEFDLKRC